MKRFLCIMITAAIIASAMVIPVGAESAKETVSYNYSYDIAKGYQKSDVHTRTMEKLDRGLVAIKVSGKVYLSWRLFDSEDTIYGSADNNVSFNIYRNGTKIANEAKTTNYTDTTVGSSYAVAPVINGVEGEKCAPVTVLSNSYIDIPLTKPADETIYDTYGNELYTFEFTPTDCSTGDVDGDGEYEIIVKWVSSERDVGNAGSPAYSGTVRFAAYKLNGTKLWDNDINLGKNVYSSAHTAQFLVYDFDEDGKAEMMVQTSLGSKDAKGNYVSHSANADAAVASTGKKINSYTDAENEAADFRGSGLITTGEEFLTVFNGETGEAIDTIDLPTTRGGENGAQYGDNYGNRSNRFIASVAYLDGVKPYAVYMRGYYFGNNGRQRTSIAGISFNGQKLSADYRFDTQSGQPGYYEGAEQYVGQGNHNCTVADVDGDGKDEFITGALCMEVKDDNTFKPRWCTYLQHGDALHIGDYDPTHKGFEFFTVHEDDGVNTKGPEPVVMDYGMSVIDADTGEIIFHQGNSGDTGRGVMANTGSGGYYQITGAGSYQCNGGVDFTPTNNGAGSNFRIFWDGDMFDELLNGTGSKYCTVGIDSFNGTSMSRIFTTPNNYITRNDTKNTPALTADLFGDWREELVVTSSSNDSLRIFITTAPTDYKIKTLMHDPVYRSGVAAEQTAYNQPPHVGFYMGEETLGAEVTGISVKTNPTKTAYLIGEELDTAGLEITASLADGKTRAVKAYGLSGFSSETAGQRTITVSYLGHTATFTVTVEMPSRIEITSEPTKKTYIQGDSLNMEGLSVMAYSGSGKSISVDDDKYTVSGYDPEVVGEQTVTVSYLGMSDTFKVTVEALTRLEVIPRKTAYMTGESIGSYDITVFAYTGSDLSKEVSFDDLEITGFDSSAEGEQTVTITYKGLTCNYTVTVSGANLQVSYTGPDYLLLNQYSVEWFSRDLLDVKLVSESESRTIYPSSEYNDDGYTMTGYNPAWAGDQTVTISYGGMTEQINICVVSITEVKATPAKPAYALGQRVVIEDFNVTVVYSNGEESDARNFRWLFGKETYDTLGETAVELTVSYYDFNGREQTKKGTCRVNVCEPNIELINGEYQTENYADSYDILIGEKKQSFSISHTFKTQKCEWGGGLTFNSTASSSASSGWSLNSEGIIYYDSTPITETPLEIGKTYTFKYDFTDVGLSNPYVKVTVTDEDGETIAETENLTLQGFGLNIPLDKITVNYKKEGVTITDAASDYDPNNLTKTTERRITASKVRNEIGNAKAISEIPDGNVWMNWYSGASTWGMTYFGFRNIKHFRPDRIISASIEFTTTSILADKYKNRSFGFDLFEANNSWTAGQIPVSSDPYPYSGKAILKTACNTNRGEGDILKPNVMTSFDITDYIKSFAQDTSEISILAAISGDRNGAGFCELVLKNDPVLVLTYDGDYDEEFPYEPDPTENPAPTDDPIFTDLPLIDVTDRITASKVRNDLGSQVSPQPDITKVVHLNKYKDNWGAARFGFTDIEDFDPNLVESASIEFTADSYAAGSDKNRTFSFDLFAVNAAWESGIFTVSADPYPSSAAISTTVCHTNNNQGDVLKPNIAKSFDITDYVKSLPKGTTEISIMAAIAAGDTASGSGACLLNIKSDPVLVLERQVYEKPSTKVVSVEGNTVAVNLLSTDVYIFAAKYDGSALLNVAMLQPSSAGQNIQLTVDGFEPDKVFIWAQDMSPIDSWQKQ